MVCGSVSRRRAAPSRLTRRIKAAPPDYDSRHFPPRRRERILTALSRHDPNGAEALNAGRSVVTPLLKRTACSRWWTRTRPKQSPSVLRPFVDEVWSRSQWNSVFDPDCRLIYTGSYLVILTA